MRALIISCVYPPEPVVSARTSADVATALAARGHDVHVVAPYPSRPAGRLYDGYSRRLAGHRVGERGISVTRCFSTLSPRSTLLSRTLENLSFGLTSALAAARLPGVDVAYLNTWPLLATGLAVAVCRIRGIRVVMSVQDMYPESLAAQSRLDGTGRLASVLLRLDGIIARACERIVVISGAFQDAYVRRRRVPRERLLLVPNWQDSDAIVPDDAAAGALRQSLDIPAGGFVALYGGNIGAAADVETLVRAASLNPPAGRRYVVIAGDGPHLAACRATAAGDECMDVRFLTPWPASMTSATLAMADLLVLTTRPGQASASVPSKLMGYMLSGRPVVASAEPGTDLARVVEECACGWVVPPGDAGELARAIDAAAALPAAERREIGERGRLYALTHFCRDACLPTVIDAIERAATQGRRARGHQPRRHG